jgi:hypothetical protein
MSSYHLHLTSFFALSWRWGCRARASLRRRATMPWARNEGLGVFNKWRIQ